MKTSLVNWLRHRSVRSHDLAHRVRLTRLRHAAVLFLLFGSISCKESLPAFNNPQELLEGSLSPDYAYGEDNTLKVKFRVKNIFDETLQGKAILAGTIQLTLRRVPGVVKTFVLSDNDLIQARNYNSATRVLTIDPGETIILGVSWDFTDDSGRDLRQDVFRYVPDPTCKLLRKIALQEIFTIKGDFRTYNQTGDIRVGPLDVSLCHIDVYVDPRSCPVITARDACKIIQ